MPLSVRHALNVLRRDARPPARAMGPIGIDVGVDAINLCQLRSHDETRYEIVADARIPFDGARRGLLGEPKRFRKLLRDGMRGQGFVGRKAVAAMPPDRVKFMPITFKADRAKVGDAVLKALSGRVDGNLADYVVDYLPVRNGVEQEDSLVLAAVARRDDVTAFLQVVEGAGLRLEALDIGPAAIRRLMSVFFTSEDTGETILVLNAAASRSYLSVISGRRLLFDQPVEFGEQALLDDLATALDLSQEAARKLVMTHGMRASADATAVEDPEHPDVSATLREILKHRFIELVDEINRILVFTAAETRGQPIERIFVLGSIARWPGAEDLLRELIDIPDNARHRPIDAFFVRDGDDAANGFFVPEMAVAAGLALREVIAYD